MDGKNRFDQERCTGRVEVGGARWVRAKNVREMCGVEKKNAGCNRGSGRNGKGSREWTQRKKKKKGGECPHILEGKKKKKTNQVRCGGGV